MGYVVGAGDGDVVEDEHHEDYGECDECLQAEASSYNVEEIAQLEQLVSNFLNHILPIMG